MEDKIRLRINKAIQDKVFPGCAVGVVWADGKRLIIPFGHHTYEPDSVSITVQSVFDIASITKAIPTSCLALWLIDQGKLALDDKVVTILPEFQNSYRNQVTVWHLLTQTLNFGQTYLSALKDKPPTEILNFVLTRELGSPPGSTYWYMNATSILLGLAVEKVSGRALDVFADEVFFRPLGMKRTTFHPTSFPKEEIVPTELDQWRGGLVHGTVHDESAHVLQKQFIPGHAGLFSSTGDLLVFLEMLLQKGIYKNHKYFSKSIIDQMQSNQIEHVKESTGLGWRLNQPEFMGQYSSVHTFGMIGFTGCMVLCDIKKGRALAILSNAVHPKRPPDRGLINQVRADVADIVFGKNS